MWVFTSWNGHSPPGCIETIFNTKRPKLVRFTKIIQPLVIGTQPCAIVSGKHISILLLQQQVHYLIIQPGTIKPINWQTDYRLTFIFTNRLIDPKQTKRPRDGHSDRETNRPTKRRRDGEPDRQTDWLVTMCREWLEHVVEVMTWLWRRKWLGPAWAMRCCIHDTTGAANTGHTKNQNGKKENIWQWWHTT